MAQSPASQTTKGTPTSSRGGAFSGRSVVFLLISVVVAQMALMVSVYMQNIKLAAEVGEYRGRAQALQEMVETSSKCQCPACPKTDDSLHASLTALHDKFEGTSAKMTRGVEDVQKKITGYAKKFETLLAKVQKLPFLGGLGL